MKQYELELNALKEFQKIDLSLKETELKLKAVLKSFMINSDNRFFALIDKDFRYITMFDLNGYSSTEFANQVFDFLKDEMVEDELLLGELKDYEYETGENESITFWTSSHIFKLIPYDNGTILIEREPTERELS